MDRSMRSYQIYSKLVKKKLLTFVPMIHDRSSILQVNLVPEGSIMYLLSISRVIMDML